MKLMLVDDEQMTREGLLKAVPWKDMGIDEVIQAKDGLDGLELARKESPQIIICDIRMPKMDGLTMITHIMDFNPNIVAILLTGYAEIDYLKQAIKLNVINFIEKPMDIDELLAAIKKAVDQVGKLEMQRQSAQIHSSVIASRLAYQMTFPYDSCKEIIDELYDEFLLHYGEDKFQYITTFVVRTEKFPNNSMILYSLGQMLHDHLIPGHYHIIYTDKVQQDIIYQIYGSLKPGPSTLKIIGDTILSYYNDYTRCYIAIGSPEKGIQNAWQSYNAAIQCMDCCRFYEPNTILNSSEMEARPRFQDQSASEALDSISNDFHSALEEQNHDKALSILNNFREHWYHSSCRDSQIKTIYYSLFTMVNQTYHDLHIISDYTLDTPGVIIDAIDNSFSFLETHGILCRKTEEFFDQIRNNSREDPIIYRIRNYISDHYQDPSLSVKTISENVFLSVSYLCTYFKNETGITLNQHITDYRVKKAIQLLTDTNMKIVDVANSVGYRDSNYFAKLFKKQTGYSPKEYKKRTNG